MAIVKQYLRFFISITAGILAFLFSWYGVHSARMETQDIKNEILSEMGTSTRDVCVAKKEVHFGEIIESEDIAVEPMLESFIPQETVEDPSKIVGTMATSNIPEGSVISLVHFRKDDAALDVPSGCVAVSIPSTNQFAVGGALQTGDCVDVYVNADGVTEMLVQCAPVIDTSVLSADKNGHLDWVTIAVPPDQVTEVLSASAQGTIYITLPDTSINSQTNSEE